MGNATIRSSTYDFLFDFNTNHASILYRFRDIAGYLSNVTDFDPPTCIWRPHGGGDPGRISRKTRRPGVVCVILRLAVLVELRLETDKQTDGRTDTGPWLVPRMHSIAR